MANTYDFIVNTESVNSYGYRVLTDGIATEQYMRNPVVLYGHNRGSNGSEVIGRTTALRKEEGKLIATVEFDEKDEFAQKVAGKVERGFVRMASLYAEITATSVAPEHLAEGQTLETVTACKMIELSIVDIGGNDDALRLRRGGKPVQLKRIETINNNKKSMEVTTIALALGMKQDVDENAVLQEVQAMKLAKEAAEQKMAKLEKEVRDIQTAEAAALVDEAVALGVFPKGLQETMVAAFEKDHEEQKVVLTKMIADEKAKQGADGRQSAVRKVILGNGESVETVEQSFDYLQKNDMVELKRIAKEEPELYAKLVQEYKNGKRYQVGK